MPTFERKKRSSFQQLMLVTAILVGTTVPAAEQTAKGKVTAVNSTKNSITVDEIELDVTRKTKIVVDGKKASLSDIKKGQQAKVTYDDSLEAAISISVGKEAEGDEEATATVMKSLQGEWKCVAGEENGRAQERSVVKRENRRLTIKGNSLTMERDLGNWVGKFEIDSSNGKFDWVGKGPKDNFNEWIGIYELDGDELKLCFIFQKEDKAKRPKEFKSLPPVATGMPHVFYTFKQDND